MSSNLNETTKTMDDESDSCFAVRKPQQLFKRVDQSDTCSPVQLISKSNQLIPIVKQKSPSSTNQIPNVKSVNNIVDNLKSKQAIKQTDSSATSKNIPKVTLVNKVNQISKPVKTIYNDESLNKAYAHKLILHQLKQQQLQNETKIDDDLDDDLTNLNWLTTFNLCNIINGSPNSLTLSPPKSPSSSPSSPNSLLNSTLDDEADCNTLHIKKDLKFSNQLLTNILSLNQGDETHKPPFTFSCLIFLAIESSERKRLSVKEIYAWISQTFIYYHNVPSGSWKNSIRHNLSLNKSFSKVDKNLLAMRDFSGKGSLWCIEPKVRSSLLDLFQKCSLTHNLDELNKSALLTDINETTFKQHHQQIRQNCDTSTKKLKIKLTKSASSSFSHQTKPIINPQIVAKFSSNVPKITSVIPTKSSFSKSNSFNHNSRATSSVSSSTSVEVCTELDAVKALLSMKSKASSMPAISTSDENLHKNRRKQMLKQPTRKCDDDEDEDVDVEEDYFLEDNEEEDEDEFDESYSTQENDKSVNVNDVTDEEEEDDEDENGKLKIDEDNSETKKDDNNPLLELSRAAVLVEKEKEEEDEPSKKKLKVAKLNINKSN